MILWRLGAVLWLFRWIFKDPKVDIRFLLLGAVLPDLIDLPLGTAIVSRYASGELWAHSLAIATLYMVVVLLATRRGRRRRAFMAVGVAWLFHLLLDGMWTDPEVFFWPFFGWDLPVGQAPYWELAWDRALSDPWRWVQEIVGLAYLVWLWIAVGLTRPERRRELMTTGRLGEYVADED